MGMGSTVDNVQAAHDALDQVVAQGIVDSLASPAGADELVQAQVGQMLRHRGLAQGHRRRKLADGPLAVQQLTKDDKPVLVAHWTQQCCDRVVRGPNHCLSPGLERARDQNLAGRTED